MLNLKKVIIHNFIKINNLELDLYKKGLILLRGMNYDEPEKGNNAAGKTLLCDAILWCLTGLTTRKILSDRVIGEFAMHTFVKCYIECNGKEYLVERYRDHPKFKHALRLSEDGANASHRTMEVTQDRLNQIIGCSPELFHLCCFQTNNVKYHFSEMDSVQRSKILDEIIGSEDADIQDRYREIGRLIGVKVREFNSLVDEIQKAELRMDYLTNDNNRVKESIDILKANFIKNKDSLKPDGINYSGKINETKQHIENLKKRIRLLIIKKDKTLDLRKEYNKLNTDYCVCKEQIRSKEVELSKIQKHISGMINELCDNCGNTITETSISILKHKREESAKVIQTDLGKMNGNADIIIGNMNRIEKEIEEYDEKIFLSSEKELSSAEYELFKLESHKDSEKINEEKLKALKTEYDKACSDKNTQLNKNNLELNNIKETLNFNKNKRHVFSNYLDKLHTLFDFYGPSGYRPMILEHYGPVLSETTNYFLGDLVGSNDRVKINTRVQLATGEVRDKVEISVITKGKEKKFPYEYSGGEGQAIDVALNLGIMKLAQSKSANEFGFYFFDEVTTELSPALINNLFLLLKNKLLNESNTIIMTTHNPVDEKYFNEIWTSIKKNDECKVITK